MILLSMDRSRMEHFKSVLSRIWMLIQMKSNKASYTVIRSLSSTRAQVLK